jgi:hypothetical protein
MGVVLHNYSHKSGAVTALLAYQAKKWRRPSYRETSNVSTITHFYSLLPRWLPLLLVWIRAVSALLSGDFLAMHCNYVPVEAYLP